MKSGTRHSIIWTAGDFHSIPDRKKLQNVSGKQKRTGCRRRWWKKPACREIWSLWKAATASSHSHWKKHHKNSRKTREADIYLTDPLPTRKERNKWAKWQWIWDPCMRKYQRYRSWTGWKGSIPEGICGRSRMRGSLPGIIWMWLSASSGSAWNTRRARS